MTVRCACKLTKVHWNEKYDHSVEASDAGMCGAGWGGARVKICRAGSVVCLYVWKLHFQFNLRFDIEDMIRFSCLVGRLPKLLVLEQYNVHDNNAVLDGCRTVTYRAPYGANNLYALYFSCLHSFPYLSQIYIYVFQCWNFRVTSMVPLKHSVHIQNHVWQLFTSMVLLKNSVHISFFKNSLW